MKYRDGMNGYELRQLVRNLAALDEAYKQAESMDQLSSYDEVVDEVDELRRAALNHRGQP